jgi:hypothetical protein
MSCLTSMSVSTSRSGPDPWGLCSKGPCPSLLSKLEATLHQQVCLDGCHVVYVSARAKAGTGENELSNTSM